MDALLGLRLGRDVVNKGSFGGAVERLLGLAESSASRPDWRGQIRIKTLPVARDAKSGYWRVREDPAVSMATADAQARLAQVLWVTRVCDDPESPLLSWFYQERSYGVSRLFSKYLHLRPKGAKGATSKGWYVHKRFFAECGLLFSLIARCRATRSARLRVWFRSEQRANRSPSHHRLARDGEDHGRRGDAHCAACTSLARATARSFGRRRKRAYAWSPELAQVLVHYHRSSARILHDLYASRAARLEPLYDDLLAAVKSDARPWLATVQSISVEARNCQAFAAGDRQIVGTVKNALIDGARAQGKVLASTATMPICILYW